MKLRPKSPLPIWPASKIERRPVSRLVASANNARRHSDDDIAAVARSIERFGFTIPILIDEDGQIIAGHCRVFATKRLGIKFVPVVVARGWSEEEKRAYCLADNQLAARAQWNPELLASELQFLRDNAFDVSLTGFDERALFELLGSLGSANFGDHEATPEAPETPISRLGDTWIMGPHRVHCGDSTKAESVAAAIGDLKPLLMVTDPPYGVNYDPAWRELADKRHGKRSTGKVLNDHQAGWCEAWMLFPGDVAYVWYAAILGDLVAEGLRRSGFELRSQIIWAKNHFALSRGDYHWQHEPCWYAVRKGGKSHWNSDRKQSTLWNIDSNCAAGNPDREKAWGHGTQKPVECMRRPVEHNSKPGDTIYDPFLGSGTTLIAAEITGRACIGVELNPAYVDVTVQRWEAFTGGQAMLAQSGRTYRETTTERRTATTAGATSRKKIARKRKETSNV